MVTVAEGGVRGSDSGHGQGSVVNAPSGNMGQCVHGASIDKHMGAVDWGCRR
jgi:outer membrane lipoprotein SlyB